MRLGRPDRAEGRWRLVPALVATDSDTTADDEESLLAWAAALLDRYAVLCRETVALDPWAPPWRLLVPALDRAEHRGELRRGYFVEGLSGVQYAAEEIPEALARHDPTAVDDRPAMLGTLDPANLYGSGAPLDIPLLDGGTARLARNASNSIVQTRGRPVLIAEHHARRLTILPSAAREEIREALGLLPGLTGPGRRSLKVERIDGRPALESPMAAELAALGFVRDPPGMAYYAAW